MDDDGEPRVSEKVMAGFGLLAGVALILISLDLLGVFGRREAEAEDDDGEAAS